ncbi:hypothetical protein TUMEXPCC7403_19935 [Tumidithrix helvetica PCC 7403]
MALTLSVSVSSTTAILESLLFWQVVLCSKRWFLEAWRRMILPLPVTLNRLAADLRVLSLGTVVAKKLTFTRIAQAKSLFTLNIAIRQLGNQRRILSLQVLTLTAFRLFPSRKPDRSRQMSFRSSIGKLHGCG